MIQVLELSRCSIADSDMAVLCKGLVDARCRIQLVLLSKNVDLRDRGASGGRRITFLLCWMRNCLTRRDVHETNDSPYPLRLLGVLCPSLLSPQIGVKTVSRK